MLLMLSLESSYVFSTNSFTDRSCNVSTSVLLRSIPGNECSSAFNLSKSDFTSCTYNNATPLGEREKKWWQILNDAFLHDNNTMTQTFFTYFALKLTNLSLHARWIHFIQRFSHIRCDCHECWQKERRCIKSNRFRGFRENFITLYVIIVSMLV